MKNNYYITTPIYYPSAKPHMGHAYSSIGADFFARFKRISEHNVFFLTGTDAVSYTHLTLPTILPV